MKRDDITVRENDPSTDINKSPLKKPVARRDIFSAFLGAAGVTALAGCERNGFGETSSIDGYPAYLQPTEQNQYYHWVESIGTETAPGVLRQLPGNPGSIAVAGGFWQEGDGGGGIFYYNDDPSLTDDGGTVIGFGNPTAGYRGFWVRVYDGSINTRWFGACGELMNPSGVNDNYGIQKAFDSPASIGNTVNFPGGNYFIDNSENNEIFWDGNSRRYCISIPSNVAIHFEPGAVVNLEDSANSCMFINDGLISNTRNHNISIEGGKFNSNNTNQSSAYEISTFFFHGVDDLAIIGSMFTAVKSYALRMFDIADSVFKDLSCLDSEGSGFAIGIMDKKDSFGNVTFVRKVRNCFFDNIVSNNCSGLVGLACGNGFIFAGDYCQIGAMSTCNNAYGIKIQADSSNIEIGKVIARNTGTQAFKLQGYSDEERVNNIAVGQIVTSENAQEGIYLENADNVSIANIVSNMDANSGEHSAVWIGTGENVNIGSINISDSGNLGLYFRENVRGVNVSNVIVRNSGRITNNTNINVCGQEISLGQVVSISDSGTVTRGLSVTDMADTISIASLKTFGTFTLGPIINYYPNGLKIVDNCIEGDRIRQLAGSTPSVYQQATIWKTSNTSTTTISNFIGGQIGQKIEVIFCDSNTIINFASGSLKGNSGVNWNPVAGDSMSCIYDGTYWYCNICY